MKRFLNIIIQSSAIVGQTVIPALPVAEDTRNLCHATIAAIQGITAIIAHNSNPDGTNAKIPYVPETPSSDQGER